MCSFNQPFCFAIRVFTKLHKGGNVANKGLQGEEQNKFSQKWCPLGLNAGPLDHHSNAPTDCAQYVLGGRFLN